MEFLSLQRARNRVVLVIIPANRATSAPLALRGILTCVNVDMVYRETCVRTVSCATSAGRDIICGYFFVLLQSLTFPGKGCEQEDAYKNPT